MITIVVKLLMIALLLWSCELQLNDHDGFWWILLYGTAAVVTVVSLLRPVRRGALVAAAAYVVLTIIIAANVDRWGIDSERTREAGGIAICAAWMFAVWRLPAGRDRRSEDAAPTRSTERA